MELVLAYHTATAITPSREKAMRLYSENSIINSEYLIPYTGYVKVIELMGCDEELTFTTEGGAIRLRIPMRDGPVPIADVFRMRLA